MSSHDLVSDHDLAQWVVESIIIIIIIIIKAFIRCQFPHCSKVPNTVNSIVINTSPSSKV